MSLLYLEYSPILVLIVVALVLAVVLFGVSYALSVQAGDTEKLSPFECGFNPFDDARAAFDVRFFTWWPSYSSYLIWKRVFYSLGQFPFD